MTTPTPRPMLPFLGSALVVVAVLALARHLLNAPPRASAPGCDTIAPRGGPYPSWGHGEPSNAAQPHYVTIRSHGYPVVLDLSVPEDLDIARRAALGGQDERRVA